MTDEEKIAGMREIAPHLIRPEHDRGYFSCIVVFGYLEYLLGSGVVGNRQYEISNEGTDLLAVCNEFDWRPTNEEIGAYVHYLSDDSEENKMKMAQMMIALRDNPETFKECVKKAQQMRTEANE